MARRGEGVKNLRAGFAKFVVLVEYDGTRYHGFQWQANLPTIQNELEQAIKKFCGGSSRVTGASRTDAGVHAKGQVVGFWGKSTLDTMTLVKALNYYLPRDIAVKAAYKATNDFNVRRNALNREYRYHILNDNTRSPFSSSFALFIPRMLNIEAMNEACQFIQGEHDFMSFASSLSLRAKRSNLMGSTWRNVYEVETFQKGRLIIFRVVANSFLPHQVRNTVGLLIKLGLGKIDIRDFCDIMEAKSSGLAGPTAPACGLCLTQVNYPKPFGIGVS
jgi:tRNA pseudouridine38-40 synthase